MPIGSLLDRAIESDSKSNELKMSIRDPRGMPVGLHEMILQTTRGR